MSWKYFENGFEEKKEFCGRYHSFGYLYFLEKEWRHYIPFLKVFSYILQIHLEKYL
jgi:hypothetical protein